MVRRCSHLGDLWTLVAVVAVIVIHLFAASEQVDAKSQNLPDIHQQMASPSSTDAHLDIDDDDDDDDITEDCGNDVDDDEDNDDDDNLHRRKRAIYKDEKKYWERGIVPYKLAPDLTQREKDAVFYTMGLYTKNTPIRFVPMNDSVHQLYGLRPGYANFKHKPNGGRCISDVGYKNSKTGQDITCCWGDTCTHEIAHLLGFKHEMVSPKRDRWINVIEKNVKGDSTNPFLQLDVNAFLDVPLDVYSTMMYNPVKTRGRETYTFNFPEIDSTWKRDTYYLYKELCMAYKCSEYPQCKNQNLKCVNDGYISVVDDKCVCVCPQGLDPADGCATSGIKECGGVIYLNNTNREVSFGHDRRQQDNPECYWIIRGDPNEDGTVIVNFDQFDLWHAFSFDKSWRLCHDKLYVTFTRLGHPGLEHCGPSFKPSVRSVLKDVKIRFNSLSPSTSHFKATATWKPASELCYDAEDRGASYTGPVNYTRAYKPCVSWDDARIYECPSHPFADGNILYNLQGNQCRNPDNSFRPWCYVDLDTCEKNYCDVCEDERPYDLEEEAYCNRVKNDGSCSTDHSKAIKCAKTCRIKENRAKVTCSEKDIPGATLINPKSSYRTGDKAVYECATEPHFSIERTCGEDGEWTGGNTPCTLCPVGWNPYEGKCYKFMANTMMVYNDARDKCELLGATLATPKSKEENEFFNKLRQGEVLWLGGYVTNEVLYSEDDVMVDWTDWIGRGPETEGGHIIMIRNGWWNWVSEEYTNRLHFICEMETADKPACYDFIDNCQYFMNTSKDITCNTSPQLQNLCRYSCGWCAKTSELCYNAEDRGASYTGPVNYTRAYKPCVSWDDARIHSCSSHPFTDGNALHNLQGNECRNPDNSLRPWCYEDLVTCEKNYCDVCHDETPHDIEDKAYCIRVKNDGRCPTDHSEAIKCAKTCRIKERGAKVTCSKKDIPDATLVDAKSFYRPGDKAVYECKTRSQNRTEWTCGEDGEWSEGSTSCPLCPTGWNPYEGKCYKFITIKMFFDDARDKCQQLGAILATPLSMHETRFFNRLRMRNVLWLGGYLENKRLYSEDGTRITWTNWIARSAESELVKEAVHVILIKEGQWHHVTARFTDQLHFICKKN